jgi:hypothetical protein
VLYCKYLRNKQYMEFLRNVEIMNKKLGVVMTDGECCGVCCAGCCFDV